MRRLVLGLTVILFAALTAHAADDAPSPASAPAPANAAPSMTEMQQQLNAMQETLQAYQEQMTELRAEVKDLKAQVKTADRGAEASQGGGPKTLAMATPAAGAASVGVPAAAAAAQPAVSVPPAAAPVAATASISAAAPTLGGPNGPPQTTVAGSADLDRVVDSVLPGVKLSGVIWLYDYQPFALPGTREDFNLYGAHLMLDRDTGLIGFHLEYRMRTDKLRPFFTSPDWAQQAYMDVHVPYGVLKAGEVYKQFGIFTDYSFYGGLTYFDGIKYDPEWGVSYEGSNKLTDRFSLDHDVQFFRNSQINGSLEGRDVVSDPDAHRENEFVARVVPRFKLTDEVFFAVGPSFERGQVTHTVGGTFLPTNDYWRTGVEATLDVASFKLYGEVIRQNYNGPFYAYLPKVTYGTVGINTPIYHIPRLSTHINYGQGDYYTPLGDVGVYGVPRGKEQMIQPGLVFTLGKGFAIYEEYNYWLQKPVPGTANLFDRSLNTNLYIAF
jgi:hypothetical protein